MALFKVKPWYKKRGGILSYYGTTNKSLSVGRMDLSATSVGNYALFGGGKYNSGNSTNSVNAYDTSLSRSIPNALTVAMEHPAAISVGDYALFGGGNTQSAVNAYNTSLTRIIPTVMSSIRYRLAAAFVGNYALFGGGNYGGYNATVDAYDTSLTRTNPTSLRLARADLVAASVGNYALFGGGVGDDNDAKSIVDAYDTSLTRTNPTSLSVNNDSKRVVVATSTGTYNYALFGCFYYNYRNYRTNSTAIDAYNTALTKSISTPLSIARFSLAATPVKNYALFGGGMRYVDNSGNTGYSAAVDAYNTSLSRSIITELSIARYKLAATFVGNYALFGGGDGVNYYLDVVDVYQVT